jgi:hypothetical protein
MEGEGEGSLLGGQWKVKEKFFSPLPTFPPTNFTKTFDFPLDLKVLLYRGSRPLFAHSLLFPWPINRDHVL